MNDLGKLLVIVGLLIAVVGALLWSGFGKSWLGRLPGDVQIRHKRGVFYFPFASVILMSLALSLLVHLFGR